MTPIICLMGPTASGKTGLAVELAKRLDGEVVSVDSALVYRGMDIGTAKPTAEEQQGIPHHLLDIIDPIESYSVSAFRDDAMALIADIIARGKQPILAGGTMLYFRGLLSDMAELPAAQPELRARLEARGEHEGWAVLHAELARLDPEAAAGVHPNNRQRVVRALEVCLSTGRPMSALWRDKTPMLPAGEVAPEFPWPVVQLAVRPEERAVLHGRIEQRFDLMLAQGFEQEVRALFERGDLDVNHTSIRCVGYRQMWEYIAQNISWDDMRAQGLAATRQLAKRQLTWLRGWRNLTSFDTLSPNLTTDVLKCLEKHF
ncbi:tRNA (adenosine(37)-N6)-dimethylallyltransferase MiaA [Salinispirillum sp. LH 10-3-1]|uniref:tRNA dimethylallyltransferase n=1 Tax=Salinispirillum sp. LH 10-3-1 TaxID=2952525 RepID=A0AB38YE88_9GAMM